MKAKMANKMAEFRCRECGKECGKRTFCSFKHEKDWYIRRINAGLQVGK